MFLGSPEFAPRPNAGSSFLNLNPFSNIQKMNPFAFSGVNNIGADYSENVGGGKF